MIEVPRDPASIAPSNRASDDLLARKLREYWQARERGDDDLAILLWDDVVVCGYDLMRNKVAVLIATRKVPHLTYSDVDEVAQEAYLRAQGMALTFEQRTPGQAKAALVKTAFNTAMDQVRRQDVHVRRAAGSFDERRDYGEGVASEYNPYETKIEGWDVDATGELAEHRMDLDRIHRAIERLQNENMRNVLKLTELGFDSNTIADHLGLKRDNVDQLRSRGVRKLKELLDDDAEG